MHSTRRCGERLLLVAEGEVCHSFPNVPLDNMHNAWYPVIWILITHAFHYPAYSVTLKCWV